MRVGLVIYGSLDTLSGGYLYDRRLVDYLRACGDSVTVVSQPWQPYAARLAQNLDGRWSERLARLEADVLLEDELNHPSLFWTNSQLRRKVKTPMISIVHHLRSSEDHPQARLRLYRRVERSYLRGVDGFIFNSQTTRTAVEALAGNVTARSVVATPGGDRFGPGLSEDEITRRCDQGGPLRVLFVGNVIARKGLETLLRALAELPEGSACLRIAGKVDVEPRTLRIAKKTIVDLRLAGRVKFLGALTDADLAQELRIANILAVPSQYEGFGIVYLEGMGFGLPALASNSGAAGEIIQDGLNGMLVAPGDWRALAEGLARLSIDRRLLLDMSLAARRRFDAFPTWDESMGKIRSFLQSY